MPFKALSSPKKLNDLHAEVRATAFLANPGLVAKLSSGPVRLAVHPIGSASSKITNVSLDGGEGVALLSRDVALVRSSDDSVWALIDISHTPKMEQVARDVRALCMRPTGETALALGWDGSATELRLSRHEVDARHFAVRGTLRACDLTDTETYAVVDGAGGGQLRVHAGPTPEPGASARVDLPREAADLDRVRGGQRLAAVYKPGVQTICVVTGGPSRLAAKLVQLDARPTDVAVSDTSLFVLFADGRAALYDADAIAAAGDGPMASKHTTTLGVRGEPRTVQMTGKSSPTLYIGTSAGEVLTVAVVRKQAA